MGSGKLPPNLKIPRSPLADGGVIHCAEQGEIAARVLDPAHVGEVGHLRLEGDGVLLIVNEVAVAEIAQDARLKDCLGRGFAYAAILEVQHDPPTARYWLE